MESVRAPSGGEEPLVCAYRLPQPGGCTEWWSLAVCCFLKLLFIIQCTFAEAEARPARSRSLQALDVADPRRAVRAAAALMAGKPPRTDRTARAVMAVKE